MATYTVTTCDYCGTRKLDPAYTDKKKWKRMTFEAGTVVRDFCSQRCIKRYAENYVRKP